MCAWDCWSTAYGRTTARRSHQGRPLRPAGHPLPQLGDAGRQRRPFRRRRLCRRGRPLSPLRLAGLPVGAPHRHLPQAQGARERHLHVGVSTGHADRRLDLRPGTKARAATRSTARASSSEIYLLADPRYTGRVSVPVLWDKERKTIVNNEFVRDHPHAQFGVRRASPTMHTDYYPAALRAEIDRDQRPGLSEHQQRRLSRRLRHHAGGLRGGVPRPVRRARRDGAAAVAAALSRGQHASPKPTGGCSAR